MKNAFCCRKNCSWLGRLLVIFGLVCLASLAVHWYYLGDYNSSDQLTRAKLVEPKRQAAPVRSEASSGRRSRHPPVEGHLDDDRSPEDEIRLRATYRWPALHHHKESKHQQQLHPDRQSEDEATDSESERVVARPSVRQVSGGGSGGGGSAIAAEVADLKTPQVLEHGHKRRNPAKEREERREAVPKFKKSKAGSAEETEGEASYSGAGSGGSGGGGGTRKMPVYVVEEHHEVLPYWYEVHKSESQRTGATLAPLSLVHIDGHSDGANIFPDKRFPFTAKTTSKKNIKLLMTSNDNFIMGSKVAGLVSSSLWVFPKWLSDINATEIDISTAGVAKINGTLQACSCPHYEQDSVPLQTEKLNSSETCYIQRRDVTNRQIWFHRKFCYFSKGPFLQAFASQANVTRGLLSAVLARRLRLPESHPDAQLLGTLHSAEGPEDTNAYLLDIDEDFFGVQLAGQQLVSARIPLDIVDELRVSLEQLFCPKRIGHEVSADRWFVALLDAVSAQGIGKCGAAGGDEHEECSAAAVAARVASDEGLALLLQSAACPRLTAKQRRSLTQTLTSQLSNLSREQLRVLQSVGLCLRESIKTNLHSYSLGPKPLWEPIVNLCLGFNLPNDSMVQEFLDTKAGLDARIAEMTDILRRLPKPPIAVTVCRSSRDGYVPRQQMAYIEAGVLKAVRDVFGETAVTYDSDLHFGKEGWFGYKHKQLGDNFRWPGDKL